MEGSTFQLVGWYSSFQQWQHQPVINDPLPVETIRELRVVCVVLDDLVEHPGARGGADPLTSVDSTRDFDLKQFFWNSL